MVTIVLIIVDAYNISFDPTFLYIGSFILDCILFEAIGNWRKGE